MKYEIKETSTKPLTGVSKPSEKKALYLFLKVPLDWIEACSKLKGSCLALALHLLWVHYVTKKNPVKPQGARLAALGISRYSMYRALKKLDGAGLASVKTHRGAYPVVTLLHQIKKETN